MCCLVFSEHVGFVVALTHKGSACGFCGCPFAFGEGELELLLFVRKGPDVLSDGFAFPGECCVDSWLCPGWICLH